MASIAKHAHRAVADEHAEAQPEPEPLVADQPVPVTALTVPGLALGEFGIRPKLTVGNVNDPAEVEADRIADGVVAALHGSAGAFTHPAPPGQAGRDPVVPEVGPAGGGLSVELQSAIVSARGGGSALSGATRRDMEATLGTDLSAVRVHTGPHVADIASRISARAFAIGSDVFLPHGLPETASPAGTHLLAHELAHAVANTPASLRSPGSVDRSVIRRNEESKKVLADLAEPISKPGPEIPVQIKAVDLIEKTIVTMENERKVALAELKEWNASLDQKTASKEQVDKHNNEYSERYQIIDKKFPEADHIELYLGSIVLNGIPPKEKEQALYEAQLESTDNALSPRVNASNLVQRSAAEPLVVRNTIATMFSAGQIDYLRAAGFVGAGWKIIVEIHYIRDRSRSPASMHKDTLGQTLFVNLNYTNEKEMAGPEFIVNPPLQAEHEQAIEENLPGEFMSDLKYVRGAVGKPKLIKAGTVAPHGFVSFVDEAIHHSTPLIGHREVSAKNVRLFLENETPFKDHYQQALAAWNKAHEKPAEVKSSFIGSLFGSKPKQPPPPKTFAELFQANVEVKDKARWEALLGMTEGEGKAKLNRPALYDVGLSEDDVDLLLSQYGPDTFTSAQIPPKARKEGKGEPRATFDSDVKGRKIVLKREMSQKALAGKLPPVAVQSGEIKEGKFAEKETRRAFFRTWVRAVRVQPVAQNLTTLVTGETKVNTGNQ